MFKQGEIILVTYGHNTVTNKPFKFLYEFGYYNKTGGAVVYIKGERNMQDSYAFKLSQIKSATIKDLKVYNWGK